MKKNGLSLMALVLSIILMLSLFVGCDEQGPAGPQGPAGNDGADGKDGTVGKAIREQLQVLPSAQER